MHLSVIIPTMKRLETTKLLAQRIRGLLPELNIEVIVVTPATVEPLTSDEFVRYVADAGCGVYAAYSAGLQSARGSYIWFMGDDDYPLDAATDISAILRDGAVDVLIAPVVFSSGRIYRPRRTLFFLHFLNWCQQGVIYRRRELQQYRFFRQLTVQADQYINIQLRSDPAVRKMFLTQPICVFGVNGMSGRARDLGYRRLRLALARRTLSCGAFLAFRALVILEPLIKRFANIRS
jgi:glycosyltransferase involved in cell wall biosynthesis